MSVIYFELLAIDEGHVNFPLLDVNVPLQETLANSVAHHVFSQRSFGRSGELKVKSGRLDLEWAIGLCL